MTGQLTPGMVPVATGAREIEDSLLAAPLNSSEEDGSKVFFGDNVWKNPIPAAQTILSTTVSVDSDALLALHSSPVTLVDAPGEGNIILPICILMQYLFDTGAYGGDATNADVYYGTDVATGSFNNILSEADSYSKFASVVWSGTGADVDRANKALMFYAPNSNPTSGAGTVWFYIYYAVVGAAYVEG